MKFKIIDTQIKGYYYRLCFWTPVTWIKAIGYRGILTWFFSYANLNGAVFKFDGVEKRFYKPGFQVCILGFQFGRLKIYCD